MKKKVLLSSLSLIVLAFSTVTSVRAADTYFESFGGVNLVQSADLTVDGLGIVEAQFNPGVRLDLGAGYRFTDAFSAGIEFGYSFNSVDTLDGIDISSLDLHQMPFLAVARYEFRNKTRFTPYIGAGAGGVFSLFTESSSQSEGAAAFAYQAAAGVHFRIRDNMNLGAGYKLLGTTKQSFDSVELDSTLNHSVGLQLGVSF